MTIALLMATAGSAPLLSGCAALALDVAVGAVGRGRSEPIGEAETNQRTFPQPIETVFSGLLASVEKDGRRIIEQDSMRHSIRVAYPFSLLQNNWGGTFLVSCTAGQAHDGSALTTVRVFGSQSDPHSRTRKIGDAILDDLARHLALP